MTDTQALIERLNCLYVWPQSIADTHADILTPRQIEKLYEVGNVSEQAVAALTEAEAKLAMAREAIELCLGELDAPEPNCSCHISPPCRDCTDYAGTREAINAARACLAELGEG